MYRTHSIAKMFEKFTVNQIKRNRDSVYEIDSENCSNSNLMCFLKKCWFESTTFCIYNNNSEKNSF